MTLSVDGRPIPGKWDFIFLLDGKGLLNTKPWAKVPVNEDDRAEIGKGHEFPTALFRSHYNMPTYEISKYASSEILAWGMAFSLGNIVVTGTGPYTYVIVPALGATNPTGLELPYFSFVQQIRPGGSAPPNF